MTCMIAMKSGVVLVFNHHHIPVQYTQYLISLSKVKTKYPQKKKIGDLSTYSSTGINQFPGPKPIENDALNSELPHLC